MSRATTRAALVTWLQAQSLPFVGTVFKAEPKIRSGPQFYGSAGTKTGAILYPFITADEEQREATGYKRLTYIVTIHAEVRSLQTNAEDAMDDFDTLIDALKTSIRGHQTLGNTIFQIGEGTGWGAPDFRATYRTPETVDVDELLMIAAVEMTVVEFITPA